MEPFGPPFVRTKTGPASLIASIVVMMITKAIVRFSIGSVIRKNCCTRFAPSTRAASYKSWEMLFSPARKIIMKNPAAFQIPRMMMPYIAVSGLDRKFVIGSPIVLRTLFRIPKSLL
ncbi:hypothetical protein D3C81_1581370 [compost metagenome]